LLTTCFRDFASEEKVALARFDSEPFAAAHELRIRHEEWARSLLHADSKGSIATVVRSRVKAGLDALAPSRWRVTMRKGSVHIFLPATSIDQLERAGAGHQ